MMWQVFLRDRDFSADVGSRACRWTAKPVESCIGPGGTVQLVLQATALPRPRARPFAFRRPVVFVRGGFRSFSVLVCQEMDAGPQLMNYSLLYLLSLSVSLSGCAATEYLSRSIPAGTIADVHLYSRNEEAVSNVIDRALANCPDETELAETACVKEALSASPMSTRALATSITGCTVGSVCTYDHTTRRHLGLIPMYATVVKKDWRVAIDFRQAGTGVASIPVRVVDRNAFVVPPVAVHPAQIIVAPPR